MIKTISRLCAAVLLVLCCAACGQKELPDTYVEGSDHQYMNLGGRFVFQLDCVRGSKGTYILHNDYIFFLDEETATILPLCNKADCLHDKETDPEKYAYCNACILPESGFPTGMTGIAYCNGFLYCLDQGWTGQPPTLYRLSEDGSKKEIIYQWSGCQVNEWLIHRDVLYYSEQTYKVVDGKLKDPSRMMALSLTDLTKQPEAVYTPDERMTIHTLGKPTAYGDHLYFTIRAFEPAGEEITDDNYLEYLYHKTFIWDIKSKQLGEVSVPDMSPTEYAIGVVFWKNQILVHALDFAEGNEAAADYYIADLDGSNPALFREDIPKNVMFASDGTYLYLTNAQKVARGYEEEENLIYEVYNEAGEMIDTFKPFSNVIFPGILPLGTDVMYLPYSSGKEDDPSWGVMLWDKSGIGSYGGEPFDRDVTRIVR